MIKNYKHLIVASLFILGFFFWIKPQIAVAAFIEANGVGFSCDKDSGTSLTDPSSACNVVTWVYPNNPDPYNYQLMHVSVDNSIQWYKYGSNYGAGRYRLDMCFSSIWGSMFGGNDKCT